MPERIANVLVDRGIEASREAHVYERLTFDDESSTRTTLGELASTDNADDSDFSDMSVMVILRRS